MNSVLTWLTSDLSAIKVLLELQALDVLTGILLATKTRMLSSRINGDGVRRKGQSWIFILAAYLIQPYLVSKGVDLALPDVAAAALCGQEILSILENGGRMVSVPGVFRYALRYLAMFDDSGQPLPPPPDPGTPPVVVVATHDQAQSMQAAPSVVVVPVLQAPEPQKDEAPHG